MASGALLYKKQLNDYHSFYSFTHNNKLVLTGIIEDINETTVCNKKTKVITLSSLSITKNESSFAIHKTFLVYISGNINVYIGDTIALHNIQCKKPDDDHFELYHIRENIAATLFLHKPTYTLISPSQWSLKRFIYEQKQTLLHSCKQKFSPKTFLFFSSLFLGNRSYVKDSLDEVNERFKQWGIYHFLSRSGLHLALFILIWTTVLQYIPTPFFLKQLLIIVLCIVYALLSWSSAPFMRSLILFLFNKICLVTSASYNLFHYLTATCFCFLLYCPAYIFFIDFQLTFGITFVLAWYNQLYGNHLYQEQLPQISNY